MALAYPFADICYATRPSLPLTSNLQNPASTPPCLATSNPGFPLFTFLPYELRIKIWQMSIEPRVVVNTRKRNQTPTILHACHEAREEGLRHYQLMRCDGGSRIRTPTYISMEDTLFFTTSPRMISNSALNRMSETPALQEVRHLAISKSLLQRIEAYPLYTDIYDRIRTSKVLETLTIVNDRGSFLSGEIHFVIDENGYEEEISQYRAGIEESATTMLRWNTPELRFARLEET
ncbi:uncharacterized protein PAC_03987 [Phialocephala subalpina]|uniref:2EXR domain-containing protein n=1 Tax=Phialocephala subalpina TaxID=576137 RepID=A0A1L7WMV0_9HELO|nr:uncharacterized protein PAC_03987 [Phialocephala subalpina]